MKKKLPYLHMAIGTAIVGSSVVAGKIMIKEFPVFLASFFRLGIGASILIYLLIKSEGKFPKLNKKDFFSLFFQSFFGIFGFSILLLYGLKFTSATNSGIITSTLPAIIALMSFIIFKEKLNINKTLGIICAVLGVMIINGLDSFDNDRMAFLGNLMVLGAVFGEGCFVIFGKIVSKRHNALTISTYVAILGMIMFLPFAIYEMINHDFSNVTINGWSAVIYSGIFGTVISMIFWHKGVEKLPASNSAIMTGIIPISSLFLSIIILGEQVRYAHLVGVIIVIFGIVISSLDIKKIKSQLA